MNGKGAHTHAPSKCIERRKCVHIFIVDINSFKVVNFHVVFGRSHRTCVCLPAVLLERMTNERRMARALIRCNVFIAIFSLAFLFDAQFIFIFMFFFFSFAFFPHYRPPLRQYLTLMVIQPIQQLPQPLNDIGYRVVN